MSLKQTYQSRKQLLVQNLETMGVTGYTEDDGLTTLINAVLEIAPTPASWDGMSLEKTAGKQILSYVDYSSSGNTEYCTVTAQLLDGASSATISGVPVVFGAYQNDVLITGSEQSVNTDSNGQASYTYTTQGLGDIVVKAVPDERSLLIQTYVIYDDFFYDSMINSVKNNWEITSGTTVSSDSTGTTFSYNGNTRYIKLPVSETNFAMEWDFITGTGNDGFGVETWRSDTWISYGNYHNGQYTITGTSGNGKSSSFLTDVHCKLVVNSNGHSLYVNNELIGTVTPKSASGTFYTGFYLSTAITSQKIKNVEIKPL